MTTTTGITTTPATPRKSGDLLPTGSPASLRRIISSASVPPKSQRELLEEVVREVREEGKTRPPAHAMTDEAVARMLETDLARGLTSAEARARLAKYGKNKITEAPPTSLLMRTWNQINNVLIWVLLVAAAVSGGVGEWAEFGLILGVVVVNVIFGLVQEGKAESAARSLKSLLSSKAIVIRDAQRCEVAADEIVPGDVVFVESGAKVPADLRLFQSSSLQINEAMLTGESIPVKKHVNLVKPEAAIADRKNLAFSATAVVKGQGTGVAIATGDMTEIGKINKLVGEVKATRTNLQIQIDVFGHFIALMVIPLTVASFLLAYFLQTDRDWKNAFIEAIAIAVSCIPEGLPAVLTVTLALSMQEMAKQGALVKTLPSVETLGSVMVICSDKTGTLTKNEMTAVRVRTRARTYTVSGVGYDPSSGEITTARGVQEEDENGTFIDEEDEDVTSVKESKILERLLEAAVLCNDARLEVVMETSAVPGGVTPIAKQPANKQNVPEDDVEQQQQRTTEPSVANPPTMARQRSGMRPGLLTPKRSVRGSTLLPGKRKVIPIGDPTEVALVTLYEKRRAYATSTSPPPASLASLRTTYPRLAVIPFESEYKFMATMHPCEARTPEGGETMALYVKGAPDRLIARAATDAVDVALDDRGPLEPPNREYWQRLVSTLASQGLRTLAVCRTAPIPRTEAELRKMAEAGAEYVTGGQCPPLVLLGLVAIMDPPREECVRAIAEAHSAKVEVKMITGDHGETARAIGKALNIVNERHPLVMTGPELDVLSAQELKDVVMRCNVYARASPANKIAIVRALQANDVVCSMTGDGVNDAPALVAADIGIAMGITGTDVSRDAAKIVLTDDNFATIVVAVREGRKVWDNLRKLLVFNQPINFAQGLSLFVALCLSWPDAPLTAIMVLYVNMVSAIFLGVVYAFEPVEEGIMTRPPRRKNKRLIGKLFIWRTIFATSVMVCFTLGAFSWMGELNYALNQKRGTAMNTLVMCEIGYMWNCRYLKRSAFTRELLYTNLFAWFASVSMVVLQCFVLYVPGVDAFFSQAGGIDGVGWGISLLFGFATFLVVEIEKALVDPFFKPYIKPILDVIIRGMDKLYTTVSCCFVCCTPLTPENAPVNVTTSRRAFERMKSGGALTMIDPSSAEVKSSPRTSLLATPAGGGGTHVLHEEVMPPEEETERGERGSGEKNGQHETVVPERATSMNNGGVEIGDLNV